MTQEAISLNQLIEEVFRKVPGLSPSLKKMALYKEVRRKSFPTPPTSCGTSAPKETLIIISADV